MRIGLTSFVVCLTCATLCMSAAGQDPVRMLGTSPLRFEPAPAENAGRFTANGLRCRFSFERDGAALQAGGKTVRLKFQGADPMARLEGIDKLRSTTNVFHGSD